MRNSSQMDKSISKPWLVMGMVLSLTIMGLGGCGTKAETSSTTATPAADATTANADASATQNAPKQVLNPAMEAAMGIRRLQGNQQTVLTTDQKEKIKPILQTLIDTSSPSEDFLQQKADAISAVYTDAQKTYLSSNAQKDKPDGNRQSGQEKPKDQTKGDAGAPKGNQTPPSGQSQDIFKQVLASLT